MTIIQAILLGAIQGVAEFLPISSSGHLAITEYFLGQSEVPIIFDILLHIATLGAVCIVFHRTIWRLLTVIWRFVIRKSTDDDKTDFRLIVGLLISTAVTGVLGIIMKDMVQAKNPLFIAICFIITGIVLFIAGRIEPKRTVQVPSVLQAMIIGGAQGIGVLPGISRSGSTIAAALLTGLDRERAGEYSFLLSIPAIIAAFLFELKSADAMASSIGIPALVAGMLTAFIVGLFALIFLLKLIHKGKLGLFAYYLIPAGIFVLSAVPIFRLQ